MFEYFHQLLYLLAGRILASVPNVLTLVALQLREYLSATTRIIVGSKLVGRRGKSNTKERAEGEGMASRLKGEWERKEGGNG